MRILMILSSHDRVGRADGATGATGYSLQEFAAPYYVFVDAGASVVLASPLGGQPPMEPRSDEPLQQTEATRRFKGDAELQATLMHTLRLATLHAVDFDAVFYPGGHGSLWDLAEDAASIAFIGAMLQAGKPVAAVCQGTGVLRHVKGRDGLPLVHDRDVTGFSNGEEVAAGMAGVVPFLVENLLKELGGRYSQAADGQAHVVASGLLITGQNAASAGPAALMLLDKLRSRA